MGLLHPIVVRVLVIIQWKVNPIRNCTCMMNDPSNKKFTCMMMVFKQRMLVFDPVEYARVINEARSMLEES